MFMEDYNTKPSDADIIANFLTLIASEKVAQLYAEKGITDKIGDVGAKHVEDGVEMEYHKWTVGITYDMLKPMLEIESQTDILTNKVRRHSNPQQQSAQNAVNLAHRLVDSIVNVLRTSQRVEAGLPIIWRKKPHVTFRNGPDWIDYDNVFVPNYAPRVREGEHMTIVGQSSAPIFLISFRAIL